MPKFPITEAEWKIAHQYLDTAPDGTKLPYSAIQDSTGYIIPRKKYLLNPKPYQTTHSFIKVNGKIYAIAQGKSINALIGEGAFGLVKYCQNEEGDNLAIKIHNHPIDRDNSIEAAILADLSLSYGGSKRQDKSKCYTVMKDLGPNLYKFIVRNKAILTDETRLDIAIQLCYQVYRLHEGLASTTLTPYAHTDIKPENVTIDDQGRVRLIDFGLSQKNPKERCTKTAAPGYTAYSSCINPVTKEQNDVVGLQRTLFMPLSFYCKLGFISDTDYLPRDPSILTESQLSKANLHPYINTQADGGSFPNYSRDNITAVFLCALLIAVKIGLKIPYSEIKNNKALAVTIASLYFNGKASEISKFAANPYAIQIVFALSKMNKIHLIDDYMNDNEFYTAAKQAASPDITCALTYLRSMNLTANYQTVAASHTLASAVVALEKAHLTRHVTKTIADTTNTCARAILALEANGLLQCADQVITEPNLCTMIANINDTITWQILEELHKQTLFTPNNVKAVCENQQLCRALSILIQCHLKDWFRATIDSPESVDTIIYLIAHKNDLVSLKEAIKSPIKCKAFNILVREGTFNINDICPIIYDLDDVANTIILLKNKGLEWLFQTIINKTHLAHDFEVILSRGPTSHTGMYTLLHLLPKLPIEGRFALITSLLTPADLKEIQKHRHAWKELKLTLPPSKRDDFNKIVYSDEELAAKETLSNIKKTIKQTQWSFGLFETGIEMTKGKAKMTVPDAVSRQLCEFSYISGRIKSHIDALNDIKEIGKKAATINPSLIEKSQHLLFGRNSTETYYDHFANEDTFKRAFVGKK